MPSLKAMAREAQKRSQSSALKQLPKRKQTIFKSTERVADSDLESETESESSSDSEGIAAAVPAPVIKHNDQNLKPVAANLTVQSNDDDDEDSESKDQSDPVVSSSRNDPNGQLSDTSESDSVRGSYSDDNGGEDHKHGKIRLPAKKTSNRIEEDFRAKANNARVVPQYNPPIGFAILSETGDGNRESAEVFRRSNLAGKQLWYITTPSSVPISAVKQVALQDLHLGKALLSFDGRNYGFMQEQGSDKYSNNILIPEGGSATYRIGQKAVDQVLHLQHIVQPHKNLKARSPNSLTPVIVAQRPVRKQPDGLKMRFRPIGFGNGETGTIGLSTSASSTSSSMDTDSDEETGDDPVSGEHLDFVQANIRFSKHRSKATESHKDTFSSEEENGDVVPAATDNVSMTDSPSESTDVSETSDEETAKGSKSSYASNLPSQSLKRKLSDFQKDNKVAKALHEQEKANGLAMKTVNLKSNSSALEESASKVRGTSSFSPKRASTNSSSSMGPILPKQASGSPYRPVNGSSPKPTPVQPTQQSSDLSQSYRNVSSDFRKIMKAFGKVTEISPVEVSDFQLPSKKKEQRSLENHDQSIVSALKQSEQKKEISRSRKKEASRIPKNEGGKSKTGATSEVLDNSNKASPLLQNGQQHLSLVNPSPSSSTNQVLAQDVAPTPIMSIKKVSKNSKKHSRDLIAHNKNREVTGSSQEISTTMPSPRKESVILPPKFSRLTSR